jgi:hypothetical protein
LFASNEIDITGEIIKLYDQNSPTAATAPAPKPAAPAPAPAAKKPITPGTK